MYFFFLGCALLKLLRSQHRASVEANPKTSRLFSAVCVQRLPLITRERTELEKRFQDLQERLELEHSMLSDDEVQLNELQYKKKILGDDDDEERIAIAKAEADRKVVIFSFLVATISTTRIQFANNKIHGRSIPKKCIF